MKTNIVKLAFLVIVGIFLIIFLFDLNCHQKEYLITKENLYIAESVSYLVNSGSDYYNRKIPNKDFLKLWNTSMLKMPLHTYTFFAID